MGYLTIEKFDSPRRFSFLRRILIAFILLVVPFTIFVVWTVIESVQLATVQTTGDGDYNVYGERITVRD